MALGAASELPSKSPWHSASTSTKTWSAGFSLHTSIGKPDREDRPGFPLSGTRKTRCGRWIYFDASLQYCELIGFWLSWINLHDESWASPFTAVWWTDWRCAGCSIERFTHRHCRNI